MGGREGEIQATVAGIMCWIGVATVVVVVVLMLEVREGECGDEQCGDEYKD